MTDGGGGRRNEQDLARRNRLAKALRDNLKRRKSQSRGRAAPAADSVAAADADPAQDHRSRQEAGDGDS